MENHWFLTYNVDWSCIVFFTMDPFKDYSIIFVALGAVGLIKLINNIILKYILFVIILCTTIIILLVV